jgi:hypothetical protein
LSGSLRGELAPLGIKVMIVEPGGFRTDFSGRSPTQCSTVIDDYAETAGKRCKEHDTAHGAQPSDPTRAGQAIITAAESTDPPALLLGADALTGYRRVLAAALAEADAWEQLTTSTTSAPEPASGVGRRQAGRERARDVPGPTGER